MNEPANTSVMLLQQKAALLLHRERELFAMRQRLERAQSWLTALEHADNEIALDFDESRASRKWTDLLVRELGFHSAALVELVQDPLGLREIARSGGKQPDEILSDTQWHEVLDLVQQQGYGSSEQATEGVLAVLGRVTGFASFLWKRIDTRSGRVQILLTGCNASAVKLYGKLDAGQLSYFRMLGDYLQAATRNRELVGDLERHGAALAELNARLEDRVRERTQELGNANDLLEQRLLELQETQEKLVTMSRQAGMAEVATGVLHNLGNALNGVSVSAAIIEEVVVASPLEAMSRIADLLEPHVDDLAGFISSSPQGQHLGQYLVAVGRECNDVLQNIQAESQRLNSRLEHVRNVLTAQQSYARSSTLQERCRPSVLLADSLRLVLPDRRRDIEVVWNTSHDPVVVVDRHKTMQILVNLLSNAIHAVDEAKAPEKRVELSVAQMAEGPIAIEIRDNGVGIDPAKLAKIFSYGFTTKSTGHGFGLHISALHAVEMGGRLLAVSEGLGHGATFTLQLPAGAERNDGSE